MANSRSSPQRVTTYRGIGSKKALPYNQRQLGREAMGHRTWSLLSKHTKLCYLEQDLCVSMVSTLNRDRTIPPLSL